jgi:hypothetical protein
MLYEGCTDESTDPPFPSDEVDATGYLEAEGRVLGVGY